MTSKWWSKKAFRITWEATTSTSGSMADERSSMLSIIAEAFHSLSINTSSCEDVTTTNTFKKWSPPQPFQCPSIFFPFFFSNTPRDINSNELRRCFGLPSEVVRSSRISFSFTGFHKNLFSKKYWLHFWCSVQRPQHVQMLAKGKKNLTQQETPSRLTPTTPRLMSKWYLLHIHPGISRFFMARVWKTPTLTLYKPL